MSETRKLNAFNTVTSLGSGEYLIATDANGNARRISRANLINQGVVKTVTVSSGATGWLRVACVNYDSVGLISIRQSWSIISSSYLILAYCFHANGVSKMEKICRFTDSNTLFSKARFVRKNNSEGYLDVYVGELGKTAITVSLSMNSSTTISLEDTAEATVPDGFAAVEFDLTKSGG